ncbi:MAG TPA: hypothetical protein PKW55_01790 [Spirochaetota bacterium]|nr:hypothetical protein [Spirochaetota bacterium]HOM38973.1 hypothetical protein [Spirochaetota bacterium]
MFFLVIFLKNFFLRKIECIIGIKRNKKSIPYKPLKRLDKGKNIKYGYNESTLIETIVLKSRLEKLLDTKEKIIDVLINKRKSNKNEIKKIIKKLNPTSIRLKRVETQ